LQLSRVVDIFRTAARVVCPAVFGQVESFPMDLIIKNAALCDGRNSIDIGITAGRIVAVEAGITAEAGEVIDAAGHLVSPAFVDPHFHMDATLSLGSSRLNVSGTLLEGIALWGELKPLLTHEARAVASRKGSWNNRRRNLATIPKILPGAARLDDKRSAAERICSGNAGPYAYAYASASADPIGFTVSVAAARSSTGWNPRVDRRRICFASAGPVSLSRINGRLGQ
jgi:hypothetical protein